MSAFFKLLVFPVLGHWPALLIAWYHLHRSPFATSNAVLTGTFDAVHQVLVHACINNIKERWQVKFNNRLVIPNMCLSGEYCTVLSIKCASLSGYGKNCIASLLRSCQVACDQDNSIPDGRVCSAFLIVPPAVSYGFLCRLRFPSDTRTAICNERTFVKAAFTQFIVALFWEDRRLAQLGHTVEPRRHVLTADMTDDNCLPPTQQCARHEVPTEECLLTRKALWLPDSQANGQAVESVHLRQTIDNIWISLRVFAGGTASVESFDAGNASLLDLFVHFPEWSLRFGQLSFYLSIHSVVLLIDLFFSYNRAKRVSMSCFYLRILRLWHCCHVHYFRS